MTLDPRSLGRIASRFPGDYRQGARLPQCFFTPRARPGNPGGRRRRPTLPSRRAFSIIAADAAESGEGRRMNNYLRTVETVYAEAARQPDSSLCCTAAPLWRFPELRVPAAMQEMNYGCGST